MRPLRSLALLALAWVPLTQAGFAQPDSSSLASEFRSWRDQTRPVLEDIGFRAERPSGWSSNWSREGLGERREALAQFEARWQDFDLADATVEERLAHQHLASALAEVRWELDVYPRFRIDAWFYVLQTEGALVELLFAPESLDATRSEEILARLERVPQIASDARDNLDWLARPSAEYAVRYLSDVRERLQAFASELRPHLVGVSSERMYSATESAIRALSGYRRWLQEELAEAGSSQLVGEEALVYLLDRVALSPWSAEEILDLARSERASRTADRPASTGPLESIEIGASETTDSTSPDAAAALDVLVGWLRELDGSVRSFVEEGELLTLPADLEPLAFTSLPSFLRPFEKGRLLADRYFETPDSRFEGTTTGVIARRPPEPERWLIFDPERPELHAALALWWPPESGRSPLRFQSFGFQSYAAAMLLERGYWEAGSPEEDAVKRQLGFEALAAEIALQLAVGGYDIEAATKDLIEIAAMPGTEAHDLAVSLASAPELPILGFLVRSQLEAWLESAQLEAGEAFALLPLLDFAWRNSDLPVPLLRLGASTSAPE